MSDEVRGEEPADQPDEAGDLADARPGESMAQLPGVLNTKSKTGIAVLIGANSFPKKFGRVGSSVAQATVP